MYIYFFVCNINKNFKFKRVKIFRKKMELNYFCSVYI